jgi:hypothetical protein
VGPRAVLDAVVKRKILGALEKIQMPNRYIDVWGSGSKAPHILNLRNRMR